MEHLLNIGDLLLETETWTPTAGYETKMSVGMVQKVLKDEKEQIYYEIFSPSGKYFTWEHMVLDGCSYGTTKVFRVATTRH